MTLEIELVRLRNGVDVKRELLQFRMLLRFVKDNWFQFGKSKSQRKNCSDMELRCGGDGFQYGGWVAQHIILAFAQNLCKSPGGKPSKLGRCCREVERMGLETFS